MSADGLAGGDAVKSRDMYFATYRTMAKDESRSGLYREFNPAFFDPIVVDECHWASAREDSAWREILDWFEPATRIGMIATPRPDSNKRIGALQFLRYLTQERSSHSLDKGVDSACPVNGRTCATQQ